jgi:hypothetical protein
LDSAQINVANVKTNNLVKIAAAVANLKNAKVFVETIQHVIKHLKLTMKVVAMNAINNVIKLKMVEMNIFQNLKNKGTRKIHTKLNTKNGKIVSTNVTICLLAVETLQKITLHVKLVTVIVKLMYQSLTK